MIKWKIWNRGKNWTKCSFKDQKLNILDEKIDGKIIKNRWYHVRAPIIEINAFKKRKEHAW